MKRWSVRLVGDQRILKLLSEQKDNRFEIKQKIDGFYLESDEFETLESHEEVRDSASKVITTINGILTLLIDSHEPINFDFIINNKTDTTYGVFSDRVCVTDSLVIEVYNKKGEIIQKYSPLQDSFKILQLALEDENVRRVFKFLQYKELNWVNLYKIFEIIMDDMGGSKKIVALGWTTNKKIERFKHTANSPDATNDQGRHALRNRPPSKPMPLVEAI